jgi:hypothetical protein
VVDGLWPVLDLLAISRCGLHAFRHTHTSLLLDTRAQLRRSFKDSCGMQIPASPLGSMPTFSEMLTANRSRE